MKLWVDNPTAPKNRDRYGLLSVATELQLDGDGHWTLDGIQWEDVCGYAQRANRYCDPLPAGMESATPEELEEYYRKDPVGLSHRDERSFAAYSMLECNFVGGGTDEETARRNLEVGFEHVLAQVFHEMLVRDGAQEALPATAEEIMERIATVVAEGWKVRPTVHMSRSVAYLVKDFIEKDGDTQRLISGETVSIWDVEDAPRFLALTGPVFYGTSSIETYRSSHVKENLDTVLAEQVGVVAYTCGARLFA